MTLPYRLDAKPTPKGHWLRQVARTLRASPHPLPPDSSWLSGWVKGIWDQGQEGSCTGHGVAGAVEVAYGSLHRHPIPERLSRAYAYARGRMAEGTFPQDSGCIVGDVVAVAHQWGLCREVVLPYTGNPAEGPTAEADADAVFHRIPLPLGVPLDIQALKTAIAAGMPVVFGMAVGASFFNTGADGKVPPRPVGEPDEGGHCMYVVGYNPYAVMVVNSWGAGWGDHGYCYMPWDYVLQNWWEAWACPLA